MSDAKVQTLEKTFKQPFDIERYLKFATEFFKDVRIDSPEDESPITAVEFASVAAGISRVGVYSSPNGETVNILAVRLHRGRSVERARSVQRNFVAREIADHNHDAAIVAFYSDDDDRWRLSFVRLDYKFADGRFTKDLSPAKRYSYLVGKGEPCHTAIKQLLPIFSEEDYSPTLDKIEEAFSVEAVTKDFFELYKERYLDLKEQLEANKEFIKEADRNNFTSEQFAKKLMGQIVFLYFLQKKGWLGVKVIKPSITSEEFAKLKDFSTAASKVMPTIYKKVGSGYALDEALFKSDDFSESNADVVASAFVGAGIDGIQKWGDGSRHYLRDLFDECKDNKNASNFFNDYLEHLFYEALNSKRGASHYYRRFNCRIPFLNGGLFQHEYDWAHTDFGLSDDIFSNDGGKRGEPDGILDIFDRFNFTMNEDEPLEREVAVDPEMLGKIFENLLEVSDRKSKGAFYTPREIVHYMCRETLISYLAGECQIPAADIREFILYGEQMRDCDLSIDDLKYISKNVYQKLTSIDRALNNIRVADPAVGSGAFLLGMLNEIVKIQNNITEYLVAREPNKIAKDRRRADRDLYKLKWNAIKNCLYAVDIEHSAVDIAKLRLWLSLVVDAEIDEDSQSDPKTLPNLDYNIMCGNSLIDEYQGVKLFDESLLFADSNNNENAQQLIFFDDADTKIRELRDEQSALFGEEDPCKKLERKARIDSLIDDIIITKLKIENKESIIDQYHQLKEQGDLPFFIWGLEFARVFQDKHGFDIVIGNPPYISAPTQLAVPELAEARTIIAHSGRFKTLTQKWDLYIPFMELGIQILRSGGNFAMIVPHPFTSQTYAHKLREMFVKENRLTEIVDLNDVRVFEATVLNCIPFVTKSQPLASTAISRMVASGEIERIFDQPHSELILDDETAVWNLSEKRAYIDVNLETHVLRDYCYITSGLELQANERLEHGRYRGLFKKNDLISLSHDDEHPVKYIEGKDIDKYTINRIRYLEWGTDRCPRLIRSAAFPQLYSSPKVLVNTLGTMKAVIDPNGEIYCNHKLTVIVPWHYLSGVENNTIYSCIRENPSLSRDDLNRLSTNIDMRYVLAVLNSSCAIHILSNIRGGDFNIYPNHIKRMPIPPATPEQQAEIVALVDSILAAKKADPNADVSTQMAAIDEKVYALYGVEPQNA